MMPENGQNLRQKYDLKIVKKVEANIRPEKLEQVLKAVKVIRVGVLMVRKIEGM